MEQTDKKISQMPPLQNVSGDEIVPVVKSGGNYSALVSQIVALARQTMVEAQAGKGLSANDFTDALKAKLEGLSNYDDTAVRALITAVSGRLDTIMGDSASTTIDKFHEVEAFLAGITDTQTLTGLLQQQKQTITSETDAKLSNKVDKVNGKGLSTNDYTNDEKAKLSALPTAAELTDVLAKKLDKEKWDAEHEQFNARGYYSSVGGLTVTTNERHRNSGIMPLNTQSPIIVKNVVVADFYSVVAFFDVNKKFISGVIGDANAKDYTVNSADFPVGAVFFAVSTYKEPGLPQPSYTNGPTQESREGAMAEAIQAAKLALFIDEFNAAAGANGKYDSANAPDPEHPFYLNELWLTYDEAMTIMDAGKRQSSTLEAAYINLPIKTNLPRIGFAQAAGAKETFRSCAYLETVEMSNLILLGNAFFGCSRLRSVNLKVPKIYNLNSTNSENFQNCIMLEELRGMLRSNNNFSLKDSPKISLASLQQIVADAVNTSEIAFTVHPVTYGKLTDEQADIMALLPENLAKDAEDDGWKTVNVSRWGVFFTGQDIANIRLRPGDNITVAADVKSLSGRSLKLHVSFRTVAGDAIDFSSDPIEGDEGRPVLNTTIPPQAKSLSVYILAPDSTTDSIPQQEEYKGLKISVGEHAALPYTPPLSTITDDATREKAEWLSLMQIAEARQINFVTTE